MKKTIVHPRLGEIVAMKTRRARRISLSVRPPAKVRLTVPWGCSMKEGLEFLASKEEWIEATLGKIAQKYPPRLIEPGYRTAMRELIFAAMQTDNIASRITADKVVITHPAAMEYSSPAVQDMAGKAVTEALRREAKEILPPMVERLARETGLSYRKVSVRATTGRWGSCSHENNISLSIFLLCVPRHLCEYVILHELCHTRHKDHSPKFHRLLDSLLGGREKELIRELREYHPDIISR